MIKIGDFAKICNVSAQTLRYYDTEGILKADVIDPSSGYRFYSLDAVEKYKQIQFYKDLGFTLEEIKQIQAASDDTVQKMLKRRKDALKSDIQFLKTQIQKIDDASKKDTPKVTVPDIFQLPFEDDPKVVGKWELCGELLDENDLSATAQTDYYHKELVFLPGGAFVWNYCWTKGILYRIDHRYNFPIPNDYRLVEKQDVRYMILEYMSNQCIDEGADATLLLYRQVDNVSYTDLQSRPRVDSTDLPLIEDDTVLGEWTYADFVDNVAEFDPNHKRFSVSSGYISGMCFLARGICTRTWHTRSGHSNHVTLRYTKGTLLNDANMVAEAYHIKEIEGREYLFVQHKSGDYQYGGMEPCWYVFQRKEIK